MRAMTRWRPGAVATKGALVAATFAVMGGGAGLSSALAATSATSCKNVKTGGTLTFGVNQDVISWDPANTQDNGSIWGQINVFDQLVELNPAANGVIPGLAKSYKVENGGKTYVFYLRDAKFSDGSPVTAADVVFSFKRASSPKALANFALGALKSVKALNSHTVELTLKTVSAPFLQNLTLWPASIIDEAAFKKEGAAAFAKAPVGSGPFEVASYKPGNEIVLKKNPYYWGTDACGHKYPYLNEAILKYVPNDNTRITELQSGALDAIDYIPFNEAKSLSGNGVVSTEAPQFGTIGLGLSQHIAAFRNTDVIQAINYAVDRPAMVKAVLYGDGTPAESPIAPGIEYYTGKYGYPYDLAKAKALMKASGIKSFKATMTVDTGDTTAAAVAQIFQSEMKAIGGDISIQTIDDTTMNNELEKGTLQISYGYGTDSNLDPSPNAQFCCVYNDGAYSNYTYWHDPSADALFQKTQVTLNPTLRGQLYAQWQKIIMEKAPLIWLVDPGETFAYQSDVHNFFLNPTGQYPLWVAWKS